MVLLLNRLAMTTPPPCSDDEGRPNHPITPKGYTHHGIFGTMVPKINVEVGERMGNEKIAWNVPEGTKSLVKLIATVLPTDWTEGQIVSWAVHELAQALINGQKEQIALTVAEKNLLKERADRLLEALEKQLTGIFAAADDAEVGSK